MSQCYTRSSGHPANLRGMHVIHVNCQWEEICLSSMPWNFSCPSKLSMSPFLLSIFLWNTQNILIFNFTPLSSSHRVHHPTTETSVLHPCNLSTMFWIHVHESNVLIHHLCLTYCMLTCYIISLNSYLLEIMIDYFV